MQAVPHYNNNYHYLPLMAITEPRDLNDLIDTAKILTFPHSSIKSHHISSPFVATTHEKCDKSWEHPQNLSQITYISWRIASKEWKRNLLTIKYKMALPGFGMMSRHHAWKRRYRVGGVLLILLHPIRYENGVSRNCRMCSPCSNPHLGRMDLRDR